MSDAQSDIAPLLAAALGVLTAAGCGGMVSCHLRSEWSARVRKGSVERVESALTGGISVAALNTGNRGATATSTVLSLETARQVAAQAVELSAWSDVDQWRGLPPAEECGLAGGDLQLSDPSYVDDVHAELVRDAISAESSAYAVDSRISMSHRSGASASRSQLWVASTAGVTIQRAGTSFGFHATVVARSASGERQSGGWYTTARTLSALRCAQDVGAEAGRRAVRGFDWRRIPSGACRVLLHREVASQLLGTLAQAVSGGLVFRGATFLAGKLGTAIASSAVTITDAPLLPGRLGSRPCDGEGVRSRTLTVIDEGRLDSYLVDGYAARRLHHPYTGHEGGISNLLLQPGQASFEELLLELGTGLLVTGFQGFGVDLASGSFSKGISGFWVEQGRISHPVQEVTIAGSLPELLQGIRTVGNDPLEQARVSAPSLIIDGFTVGGT